MTTASTAPTTMWKMFHTTPTTIPTTTPTTTMRTFVTKAWKTIKSTFTSTAATTSGPFRNYFEYNKGFSNLNSDIANGK